MFIVQNCYFGCPDQVFFCAPDAIYILSICLYSIWCVYFPSAWCTLTSAFKVIKINPIQGWFLRGL